MRGGGRPGGGWRAPVGVAEGDALQCLAQELLREGEALRAASAACPDMSSLQFRKRRHTATTRSGGAAAHRPAVPAPQASGRALRGHAP